MATIVGMIPKVRKAVFPAAGLGTRFLPATKAMPKEMLPLVDKPLIQYGIEEASQSGLNQIVIVTGRGKTAIEDHFDVSFELEHLLESRNKLDLVAEVRAISDMIDVAYVRQKEALGLGHAVLRARDLIGPEPFAVVLSDDVIKSTVPCLAQLLRIYEYFGASVLALMEVPSRADRHRTASSRPNRPASRAPTAACSASAIWSKSRAPGRRPRTWPSSAATS